MMFEVPAALDSPTTGDGDLAMYFGDAELLRAFSSKNVVGDWKVYACRVGTSHRGLPADFVSAHQSPKERCPLAFWFYVLEREQPQGDAGSELVLVDCAFNSSFQVSAFKVDDFIDPVDIIKGGWGDDAIGRVSTVIITHAHWDHMGAIDAFPDATVFMQRREWKWMKEKSEAEKLPRSDKWYRKVGLGSPDPNLLACGILEKSVAHAKTMLEKEKLLLADAPVTEVLPGIFAVAAHDSHTPGSQWIRVTTKEGTVVLAGDNAFMCDNFGGEKQCVASSEVDAFPKSGLLPLGSAMCCSSSQNNLRVLRSIRAAALDAAPSCIIPSHDPAIAKLFPQFSNRVHIIQPKTGNVCTKCSETCSYRPIEEVDAMPSSHDFKTEYVNASRPLIIRGLCRQKDTFAKAIDSWSLERLTEVCGENNVVVRKATSCQAYRDGTRIPIERMKFKRYTQELLPSGKGYLAAQSLKGNFAQLNEEWALPKEIEAVHSGPFMWLAHDAHYEFMHVDPDEGFLFLLRGSKRITLFPPSHVSSLYPNPLGSLGRTVQSNVTDLDMQNAEITKRTQPRFDAEVRRDGLRATIRAGDALYIPKFYWHNIVSSSPDYILSVNCFWGTADYAERVLGDKAARHAYLFWITNIVETNRYLPVFPEILSSFREAVAHFLWNQWKLSISADHPLVKCTHAHVLAHLQRTASPEDCFWDRVSSGNDLRHIEFENAADTGPCKKLKIRGMLHREGKGIDRAQRETTLRFARK